MGRLEDFIAERSATRKTVTISLAAETHARLTALCKRLTVSRSDFCSVAIGEVVAEHATDADILAAAASLETPTAG